MPPEPVVGVILAGGLSRRMGGGDKGLRLLGGRPILSHVVDRARPQVHALILNANGDPARFAAYGLPVVADSVGDFPGPLAGVLAALDWTAANAGCNQVVSFAGDAPFVPANLADRLLAAARQERAPLAVATSAGRTHPVIGLWSVALRHSLRRAVVEEGVRKVDAWTARYRCPTVDFPSIECDPFFNINDADDLARAEGILRAFATGGER